MSVHLESTTDTPEQVTQALGDLAETEAVVEEIESASGETPDETGEESDTHEEGREKPKKRGGFQRRIDKLNSKITAAEQEKEYWREQALKHQTPAETKPMPEGRPKADEFDTHEAYLEALVDWKAEQKLTIREQKQKEAQVKSDHQRVMDSHLARVDAFKQSHEDFHDVLEDVDDIPMSVTVQQVIVSSENGPELMYELAKQPDEYKRICALPALAAARELGKFEAKLAKQNINEVKKTKAPPPIRPVGRSASGSVKKSIYDPTLSQAEYEQLRAEQSRR